MSDYGNEIMGMGSGQNNGSTPMIKIVTIGVGGAGNNTVNRLLKVGVKGTELVAVNTDVTHFKIVDDRIKKILIGKTITKGLGAGGDPNVGVKAAEVDRQVLEEVLSGAQLVFLCAGMGGGTGTGAAPVVAKIAREMGSTVIATVTYPFSLERSRRNKADWGIEQLSKEADCAIVIENDKLLEYVPNLPMEKAFELSDNITGNAVKGIADTITLPSLINLDFADLSTVVKNTGTAVISIGTGNGADRSIQAVKSTRSHPLLSVDYEGAKGALVHVSGGGDLTIKEATEIGAGVTEGLAPDANVIFGARMIPELGNQIRVMSIVTGVKAKFGLKSPEQKRMASVAALRMENMDKIF
jgi:cell division protein FtsZ